MPTPAQRFEDTVIRWFRPAAIHTFVGAGGKSTGIRAVAAVLRRRGLRALMTTTTRVGIEEFAECDVKIAASRDDLVAALSTSAGTLLLVAGKDSEQVKYSGIDPSWLDALTLPEDTVLLVEGDGSRRLPVKLPKEHEPVIPARSATVSAVIGAAALDEPLDAAHCYNHEKAREILGASGSVLGAMQVAAIASHGQGWKKGLRPGMEFRIMINQGDLEQKRNTASQALHLLRQEAGIQAVLVSFRKGELYDAIL